MSLTDDLRRVQRAASHVTSRDVHLDVTVSELHLLHDALAYLACEFRADVDEILALKDRVGARIDDLVIAAGVDPT